MMWGGQVSSLKRVRFRTPNRTEITAMAGQKILVSGRGSIMFGGLCPPVVIKINNGDTINAKAHAESAMIAYLSIVGVENLGRPNSWEATDGLGIYALRWRPRWTRLSGGTNRDRTKPRPR